MGKDLATKIVQKSNPLYGQLAGRSPRDLAQRATKAREEKGDETLVRMQERVAKQRCQFFSSEDFQALYKYFNAETSKLPVPKIAQRYGISSEALNGFANDIAMGSDIETIIYQRCLEYLYPAGTRVRLGQEYIVRPKNPAISNYHKLPGVGDLGTITRITGSKSSPEFMVIWDRATEYSFPLVPEKDKFTFLIEPDELTF